MQIKHGTERIGSCEANVAILAALGFDAANVVSATIQMDGHGCTVTVHSLEIQDDGAYGDLVEVLQHYRVVKAQP